MVVLASSPGSLSRHKLAGWQGFPIPIHHFCNELARACDSVKKLQAWRCLDVAFSSYLIMRSHLLMGATIGGCRGKYTQN